MWRTLDTLDVFGKRVFWRVDFNVPLGENGRVDRAEDWRIRAALSTLEALRSRGARTVVVSHLGEPHGRDPKYSLAPVAAHLAELAGMPVRFVSDLVGPEAALRAHALGPGEVMMLENVRFDPGEAGNDPAFVGRLAGLAQVFVCDAFGVAHRPHASLVGVPALLPSAAGALMRREVEVLAGFMADPPRPAVAILGGAKAGTKLPALARLLAVVDTVLLGGVLANTALAARDINVGGSPVDQGCIPVFRELNRASPKILLPQDAIVARSHAPNQASRSTDLNNIKPDETIYDLGEHTIGAYRAAIAGAASIIWNGPVGLAEIAPFDAATVALAEAIRERHIPAIVGGGDTVAFLMRRGLTSAFSHVSTGGGAMLSFLAGEHLPALEALGYYTEA